MSILLSRSHRFDYIIKMLKGPVKKSDLVSINPSELKSFPNFEQKRGF